MTGTATVESSEIKPLSTFALAKFAPSVVLALLAIIGCGPSEPTDSPAGTESGAASEGGAEATGSGFDVTRADDLGTGTSQGHADTGPGDTTGSAGADVCPPLMDETEALGETQIVAVNVTDAPLWVALHETGCHNSSLLITAPDGHVVDATEPSSTCTTGEEGDGGSGKICDDYWLVLLHPNEERGLVWTGLDFETIVLPEGCPNAGDSCERARAADAGTYEVSAWISADATCSGVPCVCDGESDPCKIADPTAALVDPQVVTAEFSFPDDEEVELDLALD